LGTSEDERAYLVKLAGLIPTGELHTAVRFLEFLANIRPCNNIVEIKEQIPVVVDFNTICETNTDFVPEGVKFTGGIMNEEDREKLLQVRRAMADGCFLTPEEYEDMVSSKDEPEF
jgi:hypothetical protein